MFFLQAQKMLLRKSSKKVFTNFGQTNAKILTTKRFLHQDYYHPNDVPAYQTPSLGQNENQKINLEPENFVFPMSHSDVRADLKLVQFETEFQDFPNYVIDQPPEMFLPEEPTFFEFWGVHPFLVFGASFLLSKEYIVLLNNGMTSMALAIPFTVIFIFLLQQAVKIVFQENQFNMDIIWIAKSMAKWGITKSINKYKEHLKTEKRAKSLGEYLIGLKKYQVAYFAHKRQKQMVTETLNRLERLRNAQSFLKSQMDARKAEFENKDKNDFLSDKQSIDNWHKELMQNINEDVKSAQFSDIPEIESKFREFRKKKGDERSKVLNAFKEPEGDLKNYISKLRKIIGETKLSKEIVKIPSKVRYGDYLDMTVPTKHLSKEDMNKLKKGKLAIVREQIARFKKGEAPVQLLALEKSILAE
ncbi:hypothetical protein MHBO_000785 [Bonamia ostreae]|uniref:Uncharacterized protein n=1 Tax=Bonamia ostreae TaxID=126728 RepID=A0ABV2AGS5_9EUKA